MEYLTEGLALMESHGQGWALLMTESHGWRVGELELPLTECPGTREVGALHGTEAAEGPMAE